MQIDFIFERIIHRYDIALLQAKLKTKTNINRTFNMG